MSQITPVVNHGLKYKAQFDKQGLGTGRYEKPKTLRDQRKLLTQTARDIQTEGLVAHSHTLVLQGVWTHWIGSVTPFDLSWNKIFCIIFVLNCYPLS